MTLLTRFNPHDVERDLHIYVGKLGQPSHAHCTQISPLATPKLGLLSNT